MRGLSPLLFSAPDVHLKTLQTVWVDGLLRYDSWSSFIDQLNSEWSEFTI